MKRRFKIVVALFIIAISQSLFCQSIKGEDTKPPIGEPISIKGTGIRPR